MCDDACSRKVLSICLILVTATIRNGVNRMLGVVRAAGYGTRLAFRGLKMRPCKGVEPRLVAENETEYSADVVDFCWRQSESSRLRRIEALEYENNLLRRTASEIQIELARLEKFGSTGTG